MKKIEGLSHITLVVSDLARMTKLLTTIFDAQEVYSSNEKTFSISKEKFFLVDSLWIAIMEGESLSQRTYNHIAFKIAEEDYEEFVARIRSLGLEILKDRSRVEGEGISLYFYDFDNHLFELHTATLEQRLAKYNQT